MDNRFYLQALGITSLFVVLIVLFWTASESPPSEAAVQSADRTRTAIAMTGSYLLQPRTQTPSSFTVTPESAAPTGVPLSTSTPGSVPSPTNTSLLQQFTTPGFPVAPSLTPLATRTAIPRLPVAAITVTPGSSTSAPAPGSPSGTRVVVQDPAEFARWYFNRVWQERDYQNLWENYLTAGFKANVGSGLFEDYVGWWDSVARLDINAVDVLANDGTEARVRVDLTFRMRDGRVVQNQIYEYDFLFDPGRGTWMFDAS